MCQASHASRLLMITMFGRLLATGIIKGRTISHNAWQALQRAHVCDDR